MSRITAEEARALAGPTVEEVVNEVYPIIREAAKNKERQIKLHGDFWVYGGYNTTKDWKKAVQLLEKDGYKVHFFYEERQFVNMFTIVEW